MLISDGEQLVFNQAYLLFWHHTTQVTAKYAIEPVCILVMVRIAGNRQLLSMKNLGEVNERPVLHQVSFLVVVFCMVWYWQ